MNVNTARIAYLRSIYDYYRSEPATQLDIRVEIRKLQEGK